MTEGIQGTVKIIFVVRKDGLISDVRVQESCGSKGYENEAKRLVKKMNGMFKPATVNGKPVSSYYLLPIVFEINE